MTAEQKHEATQGLWCVRSNVIVPGGTRMFREGAKVYIFDAFFGGCQDVTVVGHHRASGRYATCVLSVGKLDGFRPERVYSPTVARLVQEHLGEGRLPWSEDEVERYCGTFGIWQLS